MLEFASTSTLRISVLHSLTLHLGLVETDGLPDLVEAGGHQEGDCVDSGVDQRDQLFVVVWTRGQT